MGRSWGGGHGFRVCLAGSLDFGTNGRGGLLVGWILLGVTSSGLQPGGMLSTGCRLWIPACALKDVFREVGRDYLEEDG